MAYPKDEAVGNKKKRKVCLPKHNYKLDNNLLTVEPRAVDPHCFDADPEPDPDPNPGGGGGGGVGGVGQPKNVHPLWQNPRYAPAGRYLFTYIFFWYGMEYLLSEFRYEF